GILAAGGERLLEAFQILRRVPQAIDMVDAYAGDPFVDAERKNEPVGPTATLPIPPGHADESVNVEKPPVMAGCVSEPPVRRPEVLCGQQLEEWPSASAIGSKRGILAVHCER